MTIDHSLLIAFYTFINGHPLFSLLAVFFAEWFPYILVLAAAVYMFVHRAAHDIIRSLLAIFLPAIFAWALVDVIKFLFPVMRPFAALHLTPLVFGENSLASFPSGHATFFFALGVTLFLHNKKIGAWFFLGALMIGLARIAVGIHWPSDILAGFFLGGVIAFLCDRAYAKFSEKFPQI